MIIFLISFILFMRGKKSVNGLFCSGFYQKRFSKMRKHSNNVKDNYLKQSLFFILIIQKKRIKESKIYSSKNYV